MANATADSYFWATTKEERMKDFSLLFFRGDFKQFFEKFPPFPCCTHSFSESVNSRSSVYERRRQCCVATLWCKKSFKNTTHRSCNGDAILFRKCWQAVCDLIYTKVRNLCQTLRWLLIANSSVFFPTLLSLVKWIGNRLISSYTRFSLFLSHLLPPPISLSLPLPLSFSFLLFQKCYLVIFVCVCVCVHKMLDTLMLLQREVITLFLIAFFSEIRKRIKKGCGRFVAGSFVFLFPSTPIVMWEWLSFPAIIVARSSNYYYLSL